MASPALRVADFRQETSAALDLVANDNATRGRGAAGVARQTLRRAVTARRQADAGAGEALTAAALDDVTAALAGARGPDRERLTRHRSRICLALAAMRLEQVDIAGAERLFWEAIHSLPEVARKERCEVALTGGTSLRRAASLLGRADAARLSARLLDAVLPEAPDKAEAHNERGLSYVAAGELSASPEEAVLAFEEARRAYAAALAAAGPQMLAFRWRVRINDAVALLQLASHTANPTDSASWLAEAERALRKVLDAIPAQPGPSRLIDWPRALDNLGSVLLAESRAEEAIAAYVAAWKAWADPDERARTLNNLGVAYARAGRSEDALAAYNAALADLPRETRPLAWSRVAMNRGEALRLCGQNLQDSEAKTAGQYFDEARAVLTAARAEQRQDWTPMLWGGTTATLGAVYQQQGEIWQAIAYYFEALPFLNHKDRLVIIDRLKQLFQELSSAVVRSDVARGGTIIDDVQRVLARHGVAREEWAQVWMHIGSELGIMPAPEQPLLRPGVLPPGMAWPMETYSQAHRARGVNIVQFLEEPTGWFPLIQAGAVDLRTLRERDPTATTAIANYTRGGRKLPPHLHLPTKSEVIDQAVAAIGIDSANLPVRLEWALRRRAQRQHSK